MAAWFWFGVACGLAIFVSWEPTARILFTPDFQADEKECRSQHEQAAAEKYPAAPTDGDEAKKKANADREKEARDYCIQRRSAIAGERQGDIAKWAAFVSFLALLAAGAAAMAALRTVRTMRETAQSELRAYISVRPIRVHGSGSQHTITMTYTVENTGHTPAYNVTHAADVQVWPHPLPANFIVPPPTDFSGGMSLGSKVAPINGEVTKAAPVNINTLTQQNLRLYLVVLVRYVDAFGARPPKHTKLCVSIANLDELRAAAGPPPREVQVQFEYTSKYNDSN